MFFSCIQLKKLHSSEIQMHFFFFFNLGECVHVSRGEEQRETEIPKQAPRGAEVFNFNVAQLTYLFSYGSHSMCCI